MWNLFIYLEKEFPQRVVVLFNFNSQQIWDLNQEQVRIKVETVSANLKCSMVGKTVGAAEESHQVKSFVSTWRIMEIRAAAVRNLITRCCIATNDAPYFVIN